jgi:hypothetical protein
MQATPNAVTLVPVSTHQYYCMVFNKGGPTSTALAIIDTCTAASTPQPQPYHQRQLQSP